MINQDICPLCKSITNRTVSNFNYNIEYSCSGHKHFSASYICTNPLKQSTHFLYLNINIDDSNIFVSEQVITVTKNNKITYLNIPTDEAFQLINTNVFTLLDKVETYLNFQ